MNVVNFIGDLIALILLFSLPMWLPLLLEVLL